MVPDGAAGAEIAQLVEHQLPKLRVAGSNPVFRSISYLRLTGIARGRRAQSGAAA